jgi:DNA primase
MEILSKDVADNDIYGRTQMINDIVQTVSVIPDDIIRNVYIENVAQTFGLQQDSVFARVARLRQQRLDQARRRDYYNRQEQAAQGTEGYDAAADAEATATRNDRRESGARITPGEFLSVCEKELASFLLKWGEYTIHWESNMNYGAEQIPEVTVSEFIRSSLEDDGLSFENPLYRKVYDEYYSLDRTPAEGEKDEDVQGRLIKYFTFHDDSGIMRFATDILSDDHPITVRVYNESLTPEELRLNKDVPRAVLEYKKRIVTLRQTSLKNEISVAEKSGEEDRKRSLMHQLMLLTRVRAGIDKELKKF